MSNDTLNTNKNYLKLAYSAVHNITRPASTFFTEYNFDLQFTSSNYNPMILGYYTVGSGNRYSCFNGFTTSSRFPDGALATLYGSPTGYTIGAAGSPADAATYSLRVEVFVLINSVLEA